MQATSCASGRKGLPFVFFPLFLHRYICLFPRWLHQVSVIVVVVVLVVNRWMAAYLIILRFNMSMFCLFLLCWLYRSSSSSSSFCSQLRSSDYALALFYIIYIHKIYVCRRDFYIEVYIVDVSAYSAYFYGFSNLLSFKKRLLRSKYFCVCYTCFYS